MYPRLAWYAGGVLLILVVVGGALWQANQLVSVGEENGTLKAKVADLTRQLETQITTTQEVVAQLEAGIAMCEERVSYAEGVGQEWERRYEELSGRPPRVVRVPVEIESTECVGALVEANLEVGAAVDSTLRGVGDEE